MIQSVKIEHLQGIVKCEIDSFSPLTILVGPNGSGKSTILRAIEIAAGPDPVAAIAKAVLRHDAIDLRSGVRWLFWNGDVRHDPVINVKSSSRHDHYICDIKHIHAATETRIRYSANVSVHG